MVLHGCSLTSEITTEMGKYMSRTTTRVAAATAMATAGFFWTAPLAGHFAVADPNVGGVPCISIVQNVITSPPDEPNKVPSARATP